MELRFTITPAHTAARLQAALQRETQRQQLQHARTTQRMARWQQRWLGPLLLCLGLGGGLLSIAWPGRALQTEQAIAMLVVVVLCVPLYLLLWRRYASRWLAALHARQAGRQPPLQGLQQRLLRPLLQARLRRQEGAYRLLLDAQGFTLIHAQGGQAREEWAQIVRLQATPDAYRLTTAALAAQNMAYDLPRHSDVMDPALYQQQLALWLQRCPVPLECGEMPSTAEVSTAPDVPGASGH